MQRISVIGGLALALCGCGTVQNLSRESPTESTVYGGVNIAAARFSPNTEKDDWSDQPLMLPVYAADVVLSAIGDTLTLPVTVGEMFLTPNTNDDPGVAKTPKPSLWHRFIYGEEPQSLSHPYTQPYTYTPAPMVMPTSYQTVYPASARTPIPPAPSSP